MNYRPLTRKQRLRKLRFERKQNTGFYFETDNGIKINLPVFPFLPTFQDFLSGAYYRDKTVLPGIKGVRKPISVYKWKWRTVQLEELKPGVHK